MSRLSRMVMVAFAGFVILGVVGCRDKKTETDDPDDDSFIHEGTDTSAAESDAQLLTSSLVSSSPAGSLGLASADFVGGDLRPREIGDGAKAIYLPRGCLTVVHQAAARSVTYTFDHCTGPSGLRAVTGVVKGEYALGAGTIHLELTADDLSVNDATLDWSATADISASDADRTMTWKATLSGVSAGGRTFSRSNQHTISWRLGEPCFSFSGSSEGEIRKKGASEGREIRTEISDFRRCRRSCPDAGGVIAITNVSKNRRVELRYDGTNRATFVGPGGKETTIALLCRP
jgi:hypothetical protein